MPHSARRDHPQKVHAGIYENHVIAQLIRQLLALAGPHQARRAVHRHDHPVGGLGSLHEQVHGSRPETSLAIIPASFR